MQARNLDLSHPSYKPKYYLDYVVTSAYLHSGSTNQMTWPSKLSQPVAMQCSVLGYLPATSEYRNSPAAQKFSLRLLALGDWQPLDAWPEMAWPAFLMKLGPWRICDILITRIPWFMESSYSHRDESVLLSQLRSICKIFREASFGFSYSVFSSYSVSRALRYIPNKRLKSTLMSPDLWVLKLLYRNVCFDSFHYLFSTSLALPSSRRSWSLLCKIGRCAEPFLFIQYCCIGSIGWLAPLSIIFICTWSADFYHAMKLWMELVHWCLWMQNASFNLVFILFFSAFDICC